MATTKEDDVHGFSDLPGWAQALTVTVVGIYATWVWLPAWKFLVIWGSVALLVLAAIYAFVQRSDEPLSALSTAIEDLTHVGEGSEKVEKVDRLSSYQKSKLKDAVGMECEITGCNTKRSLHVHHITPRSEGGGNELSNLIVACRNHHADCDSGSFNRTQQRQMIRGDRFVDEGIMEYWRGSVT
jgi:hypothetical protein